MVGAASFLFFGLVTQLSGIRISDQAGTLEDTFADPLRALTVDEAACKASLKEVHKGFTLKRIFKPVLEGRYRVRSRYSGKYLSASEEGVLRSQQSQIFTTRAYVDSSGLSLWDIRRVKDIKGFPTYTLANKKSGLHLAVDGSKLVMRKEEQAWFLETGPDGIYNVMSLDEAMTQRVAENTTTNGAYLGSPLQDKHENWKSHWELQIEGKPKGRIFPRKAKGEYRFQWKQASLFPMFKGGTYRWADMCAEANQEAVCPYGYADMREYYLQIGRVSETGGNNIPTETTLRECDSSIGLDKQMYSLPGLVKEVKGLGGDSCKQFDHRDISFLMKQAIEEKCYTGCMDDIREAVKDFDCSAPSADNWNRLGLQVFSDVKCSLSPSTVVYLVDFALQEKCWTFVKPSPMWMPVDNGPGETNLARADGEAVCYMEEGKDDSRNSDYIRQRGQCIEGTTCGCPKTWRTSYATLSERRIKSEGSVAGVTPEEMDRGDTMPNFFITDTDGGWQTIINTMTRSMFTGTVVGVAIFGRTLGAALLAVPFGAPFLIQTGRAVFGYLRNFAKWTCGEYVGCWPVQPKRVRTQEQKKACRLPQEAEKGQSPVWFMPAPGFMLYHRSWWNLRKCVLKYCSKADMLKQRVGFGDEKRNVYNCQPLAYEDMTPSQQGNFTHFLRKTIPIEYKDLI